MPELVGKVEEDEKIELMELVEKKSALENLRLLDLNKEKSEEVEKELQNIQFLIQNWWNNKSEKYIWKGNGSDKNWEISFSTGEIFLI